MCCVLPDDRQQLAQGKMNCRRPAPLRDQHQKLPSSEDTLRRSEKMTMVRWPRPGIVNFHISLLLDTHS